MAKPIRPRPTMPRRAPLTLRAKGNGLLVQAPADEAIGDGDTPGDAQQHHGEVGDIVGQHIRSMGDGNATRFGGPHIDAIVTDTEHQDNF
ncbi:hypothetical protein ACFSVK_16570 [Azorhizophilus paspali]